MRKPVLLLAKGLGLGFGVGMCLAAGVGLIYRAVHSGQQDFSMGHVALYLFIVGGLMGTVGGVVFRPSIDPRQPIGKPVYENRRAGTGASPSRG